MVELLKNSFYLKQIWDQFKTFIKIIQKFTKKEIKQIIRNSPKNYLH